MILNIHHKKHIQGPGHNPLILTWILRNLLPTSPGMLAYVDRDETLQAVCQTLASAMNKNSALQHLVVHTLREDLLERNFAQCHDYSKVKERIQIVQSHNQFIERIRHYK